MRHMFGLRIGWTVKCIKVLVADFVAEYVPVSTSHFGSQTHENMKWTGIQERTTGGLHLFD